MPELLHPHTVLRVGILYNASISKTQVTYICAGKQMGCGWGRIIMVDGDLLTDATTQEEFKKAEASIMPKRDPD